MRLVTWNVNSLRARLPLVLELLERLAPDVLCLQETKVTSEGFPHDALRAAGYRAAAHCEGRWNGVAVVVGDTGGVDQVQAGLPGEPAASEARWVEATVGALRVVSAYVPNGREPTHPAFQAKLDFLDAMRRRVRRLVASGPVVVAGDLNIAPDDRDVWDPAAFVGSTHVTLAERQRLERIRETGLVDAFRAVDPDGRGFTYWDYRVGAFRRDLGMRIDAVLASHHLDVVGCEVATDFRRARADVKPSDHAPLVAELELRAGAQPSERE